MLCLCEPHLHCRLSGLGLVSSFKKGSGLVVSENAGVECEVQEHLLTYKVRTWISSTLCFSGS